MKLVSALSFAVLAVISFSLPSSADVFTKMETDIRKVVNRYYGTKVFKSYKIGVALKDLRTGRSVLVNGKKIFPAASIIKLPVMAYLYDLKDKGLIDLDERVFISDKDKLPGAGVLQYRGEGRYSVRNLCRLMISKSDNTATMALVKRLGRSRINSYSKKIGLRNTYLYDATALVEPPLSKVNMTTPYDMVKLLDRIERGVGFKNNSRSEMLSFMLEQKYRFGIPFVLPDGFVCANKTGCLEFILHDAAIVRSPKGTYVLCVFTKGFRRDRNARLVINEISKIVSDNYR